jgi:hypothetical protein
MDRSSLTVLNLSFAKNMSDLEVLLHQGISERGESG